MNTEEESCREILAHDKEAISLEERQYLVDKGEGDPTDNACFFEILQD